MNSTELMITGVIAFAVGVLVGFFVDRIRRGAAYQRRDEIIRQAEREADNLRKSQELASKEQLLSRREELDTETNRIREDLREQERQLDKRDSLLTMEMQLTLPD